MKVSIAEGDCRKDLIMETHVSQHVCPQNIGEETKEGNRSIENAMEPHSGNDLLEGVDKILSSLGALAGEFITDEVLKEVEGLVALFIALQGTTDFLSAGATLTLYLRNYFDKSLCGQALEYLKEIFIEPQSGLEEEGEKSSSREWVKMMKNISENWSEVRDNKLFSHLSKILGLLVTMEMCKVSDVTFSIKEYKIFEPCMKIVHGSALDIIDAALATVTFFVDVLSLCWETKSLKPLLMNDLQAVEMDEEYAKLVTYWDLVKNGNLQKIQGITENEFDRRIESLSTKFKVLMPGLKSFDKKIMTDKYMKLLTIKNDYVTMKISSGVRKAPYCIELFGSSSQGKTTVGEQILAGLLSSAGLPTGKEYQASYNVSDKYMSTWTTDKIVMKIDDMANDKSNFVERPPTRAIIDVCNNQAYYANMADLGSKGKVFVEPTLVLVTTNVKDLDARAYSNNPYSIQRRMHVVITVKAKTQYQLLDSSGKPMGIDSAKVSLEYADKDQDPLFDDIWELSIQRAKKPEKESSGAGYEYIVHEGKQLKDIGFVEALNFLIENFHTHLENQEAIVKRMRYREKKIHLCGINGCVQIRGHCLKHPEEVFDDNEEKVGLITNCENEPHFGEEIADSIDVSGKAIWDRLSSDFFGSERLAEGAASYLILRAGRKFANHWDWMSLIPTPWLENKRFQMLCMYAAQDRLKRNYMFHTIGLWSVVGAGSLIGHQKCRSGFSAISGSLLIGGVYVQKSMVNLVKNQYVEELKDRNTVEPMLTELRDKHVAKICKAGSIVAVMYGLAKVYRAYRVKHPKKEKEETTTDDSTDSKTEEVATESALDSTMKIQGSLEPRNMADIDQRDSEINPWAQVTMRPLPVQKDAVNTTALALKALVIKNLLYGSVNTDEGVLAVNCLALQSNVVVIPQHYFKQEKLEVTFRRANPEKAAGKFTAILHRTKTYFVPGTDLALAYIPNGGSFKNLAKYLPNDSIQNAEFNLTYRSKDGFTTTADGLASFAPTGHSEKKFMGFVYRSLSMNTRPGLCGAVLTSTVKPIILGFHLGGREGTPNGCAGKLSVQEYLEGVQSLLKMEGVVLTGCGNEFDANPFGVNVLTNKELHKKSPINFQPHNSQIQWHGTCPGHSTFRSMAKPTLISPFVEHVLKVPNIYRGPTESPQWEPWQACLANMAIPAIPYDPELLDLAIKDYKEPLLEIFGDDMWKGTQPLSDLENWNGVPGKKFLDRIKANTSAGFPLKGKKEKYLVEVEPIGKYTKIVEPIEIIQDEINRLEWHYRRNERAYPIAKACKKDEVLAKKKCRIFFSNPVAFTFLIRRYFLPIIRILQLYPLKSECAVGINSHGPEWEQLHNFVHTFGEDFIVGGDYGKYDQKLPSQIILASLRILIDLSTAMGYDSETTAMMHAMSGDLVYAVINFNGDLISLTEGSHISGNSLTVILNGICGSLNLRCYYFKDFKTNPRKDKFRNVIKLTTYGDDNLGSVSENIEGFTIKGASEFLGEYGQVYTMPDKEAELTDFLPKGEIEFLKRKSVYHPKLGVHVGALVDKSIYKMLHYYLREKNSPLSERHACALNIDTACREWFNHGEEVYELRRGQLQEVAQLAEITHLCEALDQTYDDKVGEWKHKYC